MSNEGNWISSRGLQIKKIAAAVSVALLTVLASFQVQAAYSTLVMDASNGRILYETNSDLPRYPASLTKMMSLYLLFEALDQERVTLDQQLPVSEHASSQSPTKLGLRPGQRISVENAILGLVTKSANDAAAVIAESLGGTEQRFAWMMTAKAHALGMSQTNFANASGLPDPDQVTTARDMAILALALLHDYPHYYHYFSTERFYYGGAVHPNHNRMLGVYQGLDGIKTGYTYAAGFNLVASAQRDGRRIIGVVMGARSPGTRNLIMTNLLDQAFGGSEIVMANYEAPTSVPAASAADWRPRRTVTQAKSAKPQQVASRSSARTNTRVARSSSTGTKRPATAVAAKSTPASAKTGRATPVAATSKSTDRKLASAVGSKQKVAVATPPAKNSSTSKVSKATKPAPASSTPKRRVADAGRRPPS